MVANPLSGNLEGLGYVCMYMLVMYEKSAAWRMLLTTCYFILNPPPLHSYKTFRQADNQISKKVRKIQNAMSFFGGGRIGRGATSSVLIAPPIHRNSPKHLSHIYPPDTLTTKMPSLQIPRYNNKACDPLFFSLRYMNACMRRDTDKFLVAHKKNLRLRLKTLQTHYTH